MVHLHTDFVKWTTPISWRLVPRFLLHRHRRRKPHAYESAGSTGFPANRLTFIALCYIRGDVLAQVSISVSNGSSHLPMPSSVGLRLLQTVNADGTAATARFIHHGQAGRAMLVELPTRFFDWLARTTTGRQGSHDRFDAHVRRAPVISRHAAIHVTLVTTPISLRCSVSLTTGALPHPKSRIACAACATVSCGVQHEDASIGVITSRQQLMVLSSFML